jgi:AcrR family transcriptional regulator
MTINMTKKKDQILHTALELFANEGYQNTSTSRIACEAGVSEGLIFKHFQSKDGLLCAVINLANKDIKAFVTRLEQQDNPEKVIETVFDFPPLVNTNQDFWKLQFSLKYQCPHKKQYHEKYELMETVKGKLQQAFTDLDYENPEMETQLLMDIIGDLCQASTNSENGCKQRYINFIKQKYGV